MALRVFNLDIMQDLGDINALFPSFNKAKRLYPISVDEGFISSKITKGALG